MDFNPRPPCGERRPCVVVVIAPIPISIHAPLAGSDMSRYLVHMDCKEFQSTPPLRGATGVDRLIAGEQAISIHAPLAGSDRELFDEIRQAEISIHAPLAGSDNAIGVGKRYCRYFNPRPPCGERPGSGSGSGSGSDFNPRPPCGERQQCIHPHTTGHKISIHAPLAGSDPRPSMPMTWPTSFQSTPPLRGATLTFAPGR